MWQKYDQSDVVALSSLRYLWLWVQKAYNSCVGRQTAVVDQPQDDEWQTLNQRRTTTWRRFNYPWFGIKNVPYRRYWWHCSRRRNTGIWTSIVSQLVFINALYICLLDRRRWQLCMQINEIASQGRKQKIISEGLICSSPNIGLPGPGLMGIRCGKEIAFS